MYLFSIIKLHKFWQIVYILTFALVFFSCQVEDDSYLPDNPDLIFSNTYHIEINPYTYQKEDVLYFVQGDSGYYKGITDTLNNTPVLSWDTLGNKIVTVAIFNSEIVVQDGEIVNTDDIIWQWHTGESMTGTEGYVKYSDGKPVENEKIIYEKQPMPLENGLYYWGVWAWNNEGTKIWFSSIALAFYVN